MKKTLIYILLVCISATTRAQKRDEITGIWLSQGGLGKVRIYRKSNHYFGKVIWLKTMPGHRTDLITDRRNLNTSLRNRSVIGLEVLKNCSFNGDHYSGGTIYDPESGKTYTCKLRLKGDQLNVTGYIGMFAVRTNIWTKTH